MSANSFKNAKGKTKDVQALKKELAALKKELENVQRHYDELEELLNEITSSRSWRYTHGFIIMGRNFRRVTLIFKNIDKAIKSIPRGILKLKYTLKKEGLKATYKKFKALSLKGVIRSVEEKSIYSQYIKKHELSEAKAKEIYDEIKTLSYKPLISVIMPVYNVEKKWLKESIASVQSQLYDNWQLCIADDASTKTHIKHILDEYTARDQRIKVIYRKINGHISAASNSALSLAEGEFIVLLDHDDLLSPVALYELVKLLNEYPETDIIYSDEDKIDDKNNRYLPFFKPDWSPDTLLSQMYICHYGAYRTSLVRKEGGFREGYEGSQDYDLVLRLTEKTTKIKHIPKILYHWRSTSGSSAFSSQVKSYADENGKKALEDALRRRKIKGFVETRPELPGRYWVNYLPEKEPLVSIIIPTKDEAKALNKCIQSIYLKAGYKNFEIIVVNNGSTSSATFQLFESMLKQKNNFKILELNIPFNFPVLNNEAVKAAEGEILLLLNNDTEVISENWIEKMVAHAARDRIGAVGAKLLYPDGTIQHGGVVLGLGGVAGHSHKNFPRNSKGYFDRLMINTNYAAVTGACMMVKKKLYLKAGGFDENFSVAFNDVDFCLKLLEMGYYNLFLPDIQLYHYESKSRGHENTPEKQRRFLKEILLMKKRWGHILKNDPFYNPNLTRQREDFSLNVEINR